MKKGMKVFLFVLVGLVSMYAVFAQPLGANNAVWINSSGYVGDDGSTVTIDAMAGNVTQISINGTAVTTSWQGFYGNITGKMILADAQGNNFYDWNLSSPSGEVYASRSGDVTWSTIGCLELVNATIDIAAEETELGQSATDPDSVRNTFSLVDHPAFGVGPVTVENCQSTHAYSNGAQGTGFWQVLLTDTVNTVYTTVLDASPEVGFDNNPWDFQLLVGENGKGNQDVTPYYFYVELQ
jgi:hypothetical protein